MARGSVSDEEMMELREAFAKVGEWAWSRRVPLSPEPPHGPLKAEVLNLWATALGGRMTLSQL